jgi:hypothetical protein
MIWTVPGINQMHNCSLQQNPHIHPIIKYLKSHNYIGFQVFPAVIMKSSIFCCPLHAGSLLGLLFNPEDGDKMFLRNVSLLSMDYLALYPRRENSSKP